MVSVVAAWVMTEAMPVSRAASEEYIWLVPMTRPLGALRTK